MLLTLSLLAAAVQAPTFTPIDQADCNDPAERQEILAGRDTWGASGQAEVNAYNQQWQTHLDQRMNQLDMTAQERSDLALQAFAAPEFRNALDASLDNLKTMMAELEAMTKNKDETEACRHLARMSEQLPQMIAHAETQWTLMDGMLDAVAATRSGN